MFRLFQLPAAWFVFFFNDTATTEIYTLSLHDALPIWAAGRRPGARRRGAPAPRRARCRSGLPCRGTCRDGDTACRSRSEEHTSELQSRLHLVCRLLLEKKKKHAHLITHVTTHTHINID